MTERAAIVTSKLERGARLTSADVAAMVNITQRHARRMLAIISRVIEITEQDGVWYKISGPGSTPDTGRPQRVIE